MEQTRTLPKNVRQIGEIKGNVRVYMEDYVMSYIRKKEQEESKESFLGIFLGEVQKEEEFTRFFIRGLMEMPAKEEASGKEMPKKESFTKETFTKEKKETGQEEKTEETKREAKAQQAESSSDEKTAQREKKKPAKKTLRQLAADYFGSWEILGSCVVGEYPTERMKQLTEEISETKNLIYHLQEQEENIYWTGSGSYERVHGYFIFYEQNYRMQEYLSGQEAGKEREKTPHSDQVIRTFREKVNRKDKIRIGNMTKLAGSFFVLTILILGVFIVNRMDQIRKIRMEQENTSKITVKDVIPEQQKAVKEVSANAASQNAAMEQMQQNMDQLEASVQDQEETLAAQEAAARTEAKDTAPVQAEDMVPAQAEDTAPAQEEASAPAQAEDTAPAQEEASVPAQAEDTAPAQEEASALPSEEAVTDTKRRQQTASANQENASGQSESKAETGETQTPAAEETQTPAAEETMSRQSIAAYTIQQGDTLAEISQKYYGSLSHVDAICKANNIKNANLILPGQKIYLP